MVVIVEQWRKISDLPDRYEVSDWGRLRTEAYIDRRGWQRRAQIIKCSNAEIQLTTLNDERKWFALAALILTAFVGPKPTHCRLSRHLDDDRTNNNLSNLAWGTDHDNVHDALRNKRSFASRGHLGKVHSEVTKQKMSAARKGNPTGRKMTEAHKAALLSGYRTIFPTKEKQSVACKCGCGKLTKPGNIWLHGHAANAKRWGIW